MAKIEFKLLRRHIPLLGATAAVTLIVFSQIYFFASDESAYRKKELASQDLRKLLLVGYGLWQNSGVLDAAVLLKKLGRKEAILDPWGTPYQVRASTNEIRCRSAGPDRVFGSDDDLEQWLPRSLAEQAAASSDAPHSISTDEPPKSTATGVQ